MTKPTNIKLRTFSVHSKNNTYAQFSAHCEKRLSKQTV